MFYSGSPNDARKTKQFDFLFLLQLRHVKKTSSLVDLIKKQHQYLEEVPDEKIKAIIEGKTNHKVALLLDGYDEYKKGRNAEIDKAIDTPKINTFVIVTSRPGYVDSNIKGKTDGEIMIEGFSKESIKECSEKYLGSKKKRDEMLKQASESGIISVGETFVQHIFKPHASLGLSVIDGGLLQVPIILLMTCVLFDNKHVLPRRRTDIVRQIFELTIDRTELKIAGSDDVEWSKDDLLFDLGELAWESLQDDEKELLLKKVIQVSLASSFLFSNSFMIKECSRSNM